MYKPHKLYLVSEEPTGVELAKFRFPVIFRIQKEDGTSYDVTYNTDGERSVLVDTNDEDFIPLTGTKEGKEFSGSIKLKPFTNDVKDYPYQEIFKAPLNGVYPIFTTLEGGFQQTIGNDNVDHVQYLIHGHGKSHELSSVENHNYTGLTVYPKLFNVKVRNQEFKWLNLSITDTNASVTKDDKPFMASEDSDIVTKKYFNDNQYNILIPHGEGYSIKDAIIKPGKYLITGKKAINLSLDHESSNIGASGMGSVSIGLDSKSTNQYSTAIGPGNTSEGVGSTILGGYSNAIGEASTIVGFNSTSRGTSSVVIGSGSEVNGNANVSIGYSNKTSSEAYSIVVGTESLCSGLSSTAIGRKVNVTHPASYGFGFYLDTNGAFSTVLGYYNVLKSDQNQTINVPIDDLLVVGNGTSENRSNALELKKNGQLLLTTVNNNLIESNPKSVTTKEFVDDKISNFKLPTNFSNETQRMSALVDKSEDETYNRIMITDAQGNIGYTEEISNIVLTSPNGSKFKLSVSDLGELITEKI